jgi:hypothetical protein
MYSNHPVVLYSSIQNFHPTGSNIKENCRLYKVLQKQICDELIFAHHAVADSVISSEICCPLSIMSPQMTPG